MIVVAAAAVRGTGTEDNSFRLFADLLFSALSPSCSPSHRHIAYRTGNYCGSYKYSFPNLAPGERGGRPVK
ncbi:hypothetical protein J6590_079768 [Homalodisca vitripennis]|nr:hypothetical protein J6590_079768 [Homalodisca vitripennis]